MKTHRYCNRCGSPVTKVTDKDLRWSMRNIHNPDRSAYKFNCSSCEEYLFSFETFNVRKYKRSKKGGRK